MATWSQSPAWSWAGPDQRNRRGAGPKGDAIWPEQGKEIPGYDFRKQSGRIRIQMGGIPRDR